jgi:hypothetical protein
MVGIDWISAGIFLVAYVVSQMRTLSVRQRYLVLAIAMALITVRRFAFGFQGVNGIFTGIAAALCAFYAYKASKAPRR